MPSNEMVFSSENVFIFLFSLLLSHFFQYFFNKSVSTQNNTMEDIRSIDLQLLSALKICEYVKKKQLDMWVGALF